MKRSLLGLMVVAAVIVVISVATGTRRSPGHADGSAMPVVQGGAAPEPRTPVGTVSRVQYFLWRGPMSVSAYRVEIRDAAGTAVFDTRLRQKSFSVPRELRDRLRPGVDYQWKVTRLDERGTVVDASPFVKFTIAR